MTLTNEDLFAIGQLIDTKFDAKLKPIETKLDSIENRMDSIESRMDSLESRVDSLESRMDSMENEIHQIKLCQENMILPRLNTIEACYTDTYSRYKEYTDKMDAAFVDIDLLKKVVSEHSEKLKKIS